jgi:regulator of cell morphogenesis and NO signaling
MSQPTELLSGQRVSDIAVRFPHAASVFLQYDIDFCCGGSISLKEACERTGADLQTLQREILENQNNRRGVVLDFTSWSPSLLADYIVEHHHAYVKESIPVLLDLLNRVCDAHGADRPELLTVRETFRELATELITHMRKEELVLFPALKMNASHDDIVNPVAVMRDEHTHAGDLIKKLREWSAHYALPERACPTFRVTYSRLREFDEDLMQHIHLENNILFPHALKNGTQSENPQ